MICAGVVLLQLSKSAKDVPDTAVFAGDLDQVRTIAEQEQPESEPKADAIRGTAAIVRRFSQARQKMELDEARRLHEEKQADLEPIGENEHIEWDGLRRRRTTYGSNSLRSRRNTTPFPAFEQPPGTPQQHPPLGMSHFPVESDSDHEDERPSTGGLQSSFFGTISQRAKSVIGPRSRRSTQPQIQSPMHPVPLTEISVPAYSAEAGNAYYGHEGMGDDNSHGAAQGSTEYKGAGERHITIVDDASQRTGSRGSTLHPAPTPPPHSARRQFSFQNVFRKGQAAGSGPNEVEPPSRSPIVRKHLGGRLGSSSSVKGATEEERLGLVKGDTATGQQPALPPYEDDEEEDEWIGDDKRKPLSSSPERDLTSRGKDREKDLEAGVDTESAEYYEAQRRKWGGNGGGRGRGDDDDRSGGGTGGAFI